MNDLEKFEKNSPLRMSLKGFERKRKNTFMEVC